MTMRMWLAVLAVGAASIWACDDDPSDAAVREGGMPNAGGGGAGATGGMDGGPSSGGMAGGNGGAAGAVFWGCGRDVVGDACLTCLLLECCSLQPSERTGASCLAYSSEQPPSDLERPPTPCYSTGFMGVRECFAARAGADSGDDSRQIALECSALYEGDADGGSLDHYGDHLKRVTECAVGVEADDGGPGHAGRCAAECFPGWR